MTELNLFENFQGANLDRLIECMKRIKSEGLTVNKYTQAGINQSSGNVCIWSEDWLGCVYCSIGFDVSWSYSCPECGEEYDFDTIDNLEDIERTAYANDNQLLAGALAALIDAREQIETLEDQLSDIETLADWEKRNVPADNYRDFFHECFARLNGHYPAPSVTSDYDKSVIFEAIENGCAE